jgi:hypothetical protein
VKKKAKIALIAFGAVVVVVGSWTIGFYEGLEFGAGAASRTTTVDKVDRAFNDVRDSVSALESNDGAVSRHQREIELRSAVVSLGILANTESYGECTESNKLTLSDAAGYIAAHADPVLFNSDSLLTKGLKFCEHAREDHKVTVSYMTTGKDN